MTDKGISILIVDDEEPIRRLVESYLSEHSYNCVTAAGADEATRLLSSTFFNVVITDIRMPGASGLELCQLIHSLGCDTVVIVVSGMTDINYAIEAMHQGAFDYITKPFHMLTLLRAVDRAVKYQRFLTAKRHHDEYLEEAVRTRTNELRLLNDNLNTTLEALYSNYRATLRALARALEARDVETGGHSDRVVAYSLRLGKEMKLSHNDLIALEQGALLHDIGKIGVPDSILRKRSALSEEEWAKMREHINYGLHIISRIDFLEGARAVVAQHHEKYDGGGYPSGLCGELIHLHARIFAVADAFDAITSDRPYRPAQSYTQARAEIVANCGSHFDPRVVAAFENVSEQEWVEISKMAESADFIEHLIDKSEIRSFIISLKQASKPTGPLSLTAPLSVN